MGKKQFLSYAKGPWSGIPSDLWENSAWQLKHRITTLRELEQFLSLTKEEKAGILLAGANKLAMAITPYFFTLIDTDNPHCPIRRQVIPRVEESYTSPEEFADPCGEEPDAVVPGLIHRYPDRVLFLVTDRCATYCRYCTRSRIVSGAGEMHLIPQWKNAFKYLQEHTEVRDILLSGGDPLLLPDERLEELLTQLTAIEHIDIVRMGSRVPIFLPQRITDKLCQTLQKFSPLYLSLHINHPKELTKEAKYALDKLADHGVVMGSQTVLLRDINDNAEIQKELYQNLLLCRVRPYYLYQCDLINGSSHFRTSIQEGIDIIHSLRGYTTGYAIPQYVVDGPGGGGKIPLNPDYIIQHGEKETTLRNYEGKKFSYPIPNTPPQEELDKLIIMTEEIS